MFVFLFFFCVRIYVYDIVHIVIDKNDSDKILGHQKFCVFGKHRDDIQQTFDKIKIILNAINYR